jgi:GrpB-like predicted nucleotidyltransferase (UPF0157 family)
MQLFKPARKPVAEYRDWDPRYPNLVRSLVSQFGELRTDVTIEHVGSTAISGCGGKGVVDLLALYEDGGLTDAKDWLLSLGLSRQGAEFSRPWSESRPMYLGWYQYDREDWLIYVHVVHVSSDEVRRFRSFRKVFTDNPELVAQYCMLKRKIVASGIRNTDEYAVQKRAFVRAALGAEHKLRDSDL